MGGQLSWSHRQREERLVWSSRIAIGENNTMGVPFGMT
jgi:hypothetical protein